MINGMYLSTMGAMVQATQHGLLANNLANAETVGYKPDYGTFRELLAESALQPGWRPEVNELLEKTGGGAWMNQTVTAFHPGPVRTTGNPLNAALRQEDAVFRVQTPDGEERLTRDGAFTLNPEGFLTMADGETLVLDDGGQPILVEGSVEIRDDGALVDVGTGEVVGQLGLSRVDDPTRMKKLGDNLYALDEAEMIDGPVRVLGGAVEESATNPVREMVNMIQATRAYQANMKLVTIQDGTLGRTVTQVGSVR
jgi:flagellar basal-body rod protein FlgG